MVDVGTSEAERALMRQALLERRLRRSAVGVAQPVPRLIPQQHAAGPTPLSAAQLPLWYLHQSAPNSDAYNELVTVCKTGPFDVAAFRWAFEQLVARHESWRSTFEVIDGEPRQIVGEKPSFDLTFLDLSDLPIDEARATGARLAADDAKRPYDLAGGPLLRPRLVRLSPEEHRLYLGLHHIIFDSVTIYGIVLPELITLYRARVEGTEPSLPEPTQYSEYARWEQDWVRGPQVAARIDRWRDRLAGVTPLDLPFDHPRPTRQRFVGSRVPLAVDAAAVAQLRAVATAQGASLFQVVAAGYAYWLSRYTGRDDVVFATVKDLRDRPELESLVGYCLTPVVLRASVSIKATFAELVAQMRREALSALSDAVPFECIVRALDAPRDPRVNPVFQASLVLEPSITTPDPAWSIDPPVGPEVAKFDIHVEVHERSDGSISGHLIHNVDLLDSGTAQLMADHLGELLTRVAAHPDAPLAELAGPSDNDRRRQLDEFNPPALAVPERGIAELVLEQAERTPGATAIRVGGDQLTYRELVQRASQIASRLGAAGAGRGTVVATSLERSIELVPALLGVLVCGSTYLPIEPRHPVQRSRLMMDAAGAELLLTDSACAPTLPDLGVDVVTLDGPSTGHERCEPVRTAPTDLAYMIYTSGSTGTPKGVQVEHGSVVNLMTTLPAELGLSAADTVLSVVSYTFDVSVGDIFPTLAVGATLVLATSEEVHRPRLLAHLIDKSGATYMSATPTTWSALLSDGWTGNPALTAASVGEPLTEVLATSLLGCCRAVWNGWGPTEATVYAGGGFVRSGEPITVGRPLPGTRIYVTDAAGGLLPTGVPGEIVIGGPGVARGYANRPEQTAERFADDPFSNGGRIYRSGDRGRLLPDGRLQHLGRFDNQVKIRGFRVELGEIEAVLDGHPAVSAVAVDARKDRDGQLQLVAYVVGERDEVTDLELRSWVRHRLPDYMVPAVIVDVPALPSLDSGKLDRAALPDPPADRERALAGEIDARTVTQRRLAMLWTELLGTEVTNVLQDFFDLGGHSLLAARLVGQVETQFGTPVSIADFLDRGTTVAGLAELVDAGKIDPLSTAAERRVFFVFPDLASSMSMRHLTTVWSSEMSAHPLPASLQVTRTSTVEEIADPLVGAIRDVQPHGPYSIVGYSFCGLLAYELARRLEESGEQVEWLGLVDTVPPDMARELTRKRLSPAGVVARLRRIPKSGLPTALIKRKLWAARERMIEKGLVVRPPDEAYDFNAGWEIMQRYTRRGISAPMSLFVTADTVDETGMETLGWDRVHEGPLQTRRLPGGHGSILAPEHARALADMIADTIPRPQDAEQ